MKYDHSSAVPPDAITGRLTFSASGVEDVGRDSWGCAERSCKSIRRKRTASGVSTGHEVVQSWTGQFMTVLAILNALRFSNFLIMKFP